MLEFFFALHAFLFVFLVFKNFKMPIDITTENEMFSQGKRPRPENPYQLCTTELEMQVLYQKQLNYFRSAKKHLKMQPISEAKQRFFLEYLPLFAKENPNAQEMVDIICSKIGSYKETDGIFDSLSFENMPVPPPSSDFIQQCYDEDTAILNKMKHTSDLKSLRRNFDIFLYVNRKSAPKRVKEVVLVKEQTLDEILALRLANAEKKGEVIIL
jgi:hypothetical protein